MSLSAFATPQERFFKFATFDDVKSVLESIQEGIDPNVTDAKGNTALLIALREKSTKVAMALIKQPTTDVELANRAGETPLMLACLYGQLPIVRELMEVHEVEPNKTGWTPLHYAASMGQNEVVSYLLDNSAYIDAESPNGTTPLMMAVRGGYINTVKILLDGGADMNIKNQQGMDAIDFAKRYQQPEIESGLVSRRSKLAK